MGKIADLVLALDSAHCLNFRVEVNHLEALEWAEKFPYYNGIRKGDLPRLIKGINERVPPMNFGGDNPNNGKPHHHFEIGNEGSLVIYLVIRNFYLPEGTDVNSLKTDIMSLAKRSHADEIGDVSEDSHEIRIRMWWD